MAVVILTSYVLAIFKVEIKAIWAVLFLVLAYYACVFTRKWIKPSTALFALLGGIIVTHIPWWISHNVTHGVSYDALIDYFFKGTKMLYSTLGVIVGYLTYKLAKAVKPMGN